MLVRAFLEDALPGTETERGMAERLVREGRKHLRRQRELISWLAEQGHSTSEAEKLLNVFEDIQRLHREHVSRLKAH